MRMIRKFSSQIRGKLYKSHVPTSNVEKVGLTIRSAFGALLNPERADLVAILGETTGVIALERMRDTMRLDPVGKRILEERPRLKTCTIDLKHLELLPENTFGRSYVEFLNENGFSPDSRSEVRFVDDEELAYVMLRYREVHDFWHILCGSPPDIAGEIALKWFEAAQTGLPSTVLSAAVGPLALLKPPDGMDFREVIGEWTRIGAKQEKSSTYIGPQQLRKLLTTDIPWALRSGRQAVNLMNVEYETCFEEDLSDLRKRLRVEPIQQ